MDDRRETGRGKEARETAQAQKLEKPEPEKTAERPLNRAQADIRLAFQKENQADWAESLKDWGYIVAEVRQPDLEQRDRFELAAMREAKEKGVWMLAERGVEQFTPEQLQSARTFYEAWAENKQEPFSFESYVSYVQERQQERLEQLTERTATQPEQTLESAASLLAAYVKPEELVVVNERGQIYSLNQRTTGMERDELDKYLATVDRAALPSVLEAQAAMQERRQPEIEREAQWWQRIEQAIDRGGGYEAARREGWLTKAYGPDELQQLREFRTEIVGMRQELNSELDNRGLSWEHRAALRDLHHATSHEIATLALEQSGYEPNFIKMGVERLGDFADSIKGMGGKALDMAGGLLDFAEKMVDGLVDFFMTPSLPTPEVIHARREAREEKAQQATDWKRYDADTIYRAQINEQERQKREQAEREYAKKRERELHPYERERER